jgi:hypothetical protein
MNNFIRSHILGFKSCGQSFGIMKSLILNHTCCPTSNCTCLCILLACLSYFLWACSNTLLAWAYIFSHPLTIPLLIWNGHSLYIMASCHAELTWYQKTTLLNWNLSWLFLLEPYLPISKNDLPPPRWHPSHSTLGVVWWKSFKVYHLGWKGSSPYQSPFSHIFWSPSKLRNQKVSNILEVPYIIPL